MKVSPSIILFFRSFPISIFASSQSWREPDQEAESAVELRGPHFRPEDDQLRHLPAGPERQRVRKKIINFVEWIANDLRVSPFSLFSRKTGAF